MSGVHTVRPVAPRTQGDRVVVPDVARGFAIFAMLVAHAIPLVPQVPGAVRFLERQLNDVASPLFACVMGMATAIVIAKTRLEPHGVRAVIVQNVIRGCILVILGVWLQTWGSWIAIILSFLGIVLAIGTPLLLLPTKALIAVIAVIVVAGAPINAFVLDVVEPTMALPGSLGATFIDWVFLNPHYRVTNLLPWFLFGAVVFRIGFTSRRLAWTMLILAPLAWGGDFVIRRVFSVERGPSGSYLDTLHDTGLVLGALAAIMLLAAVRAEAPARVIRAVFVPFRAIGTVALSLYVLQVAIVAWLARSGALTFSENNYAAWCLVVLAVPAAGILWWRFIGKGPIEWVIGFLSGRYRVARVPRSAHTTTPA
ncbi:DUF418 domain-containing protein [Herbiconiux sp. KACC 21604]|uniref:DUF418 domain-containing protein n=1 Tax=unclassified Herbiconiux TaxID=2618217 RepID=UPI001493003C|nr:DUF418 domain-containing protein [Herbiconiux sp. SALV-R1]QJU54564.1 DUF418 domain-containing protein [Herbiconiux sp. SALV-R1]WPO85649.1 DUF418 domain-containing protein [Herbiconiux sp. KACC 21604]